MLVLVNKFEKSIIFLKIIKKNFIIQISYKQIEKKLDLLVNEIINFNNFDSNTKQVMIFLGINFSRIKMPSLNNDSLNSNLELNLNDNITVQNQEKYNYVFKLLKQKKISK